MFSSNGHLIWRQLIIIYAHKKFYIFWSWKMNVFYRILFFFFWNSVSFSVLQMWLSLVWSRKRPHIMLTKSLASLDLHTVKKQQNQIQGDTMLVGKQTVGFAFAHNKLPLVGITNGQDDNMCIFFIFSFKFSVYVYVQH